MLKPRLSFWQIWNMNFGFLGIQVGFALQNTNVSRIFETLGARPDEIPILWLAAPMTGMIVQPIIGYMSDRTWGRLGRRRPYFLAGAILASSAMLVMPYSAALWFAAMMLWVMDASINISMEPFRALVGDLLPSEQRTTGFAVQSFFIGIGAVAASALPYILARWFHVPNTAAAGVIPQSVILSFALGAAAFLGAVSWTVFRTREYPPEDLASFRMRQREKRGVGGMLGEIATSIVRMPRTMAYLAVVQFFSWFALFCMWIYTTGAVTHHLFHSSDPTSAGYNEGADWVGILFSVYNGVAALAAFGIPWLAAKSSRRTAHAVSLLCGALGLLSFTIAGDPLVLLASMVGVGIAWASILSMPYAILAGSLPPEKMGFYMGVFNFFIVIPQITAALGLGPLMRTALGNDPMNVILLGGLSLVVAAGLTLRVPDIDEPHQAGASRD
jgi:maltose/moltooligosaccharide transporter